MSDKHEKEESIMPKILLVENCGDCKHCHITSMNGDYRCWHKEWSDGSAEPYKTIGKDWKILPEWCPLEDR